MNHYAFTLKTVKGKPVVDVVLAGFKARGDADKASLTLVGRHGNGYAVSLSGELREGDPPPADEFGRAR